MDVRDSTSAFVGVRRLAASHAALAGEAGINWRGDGI